MQQINLFWFRRDLRLHDNHGLYRALKSSLPVLPIFIFDRNILDELPNKTDARFMFIHDELSGIKATLEKMSSSLWTYYGTPLEAYKELAEKFDIHTVFTNHDYEPYATQRDSEIQDFLKTQGIGFQSFKDQVVFEKSEVLTGQDKPYSVFSPYGKKWRATLTKGDYAPYPSENHWSAFVKNISFKMPSLREMGFQRSDISIPKRIVQDPIIETYDQTRNFPALKEGTTKMGIHLRFGTVSVRQMVTRALALNDTYLNELIWREFYMQILYHYPQVVTKAFKPKYDHIPWCNSEAEFEKWCKGETGYPMVDAGMRELNATGYMHNRVRMITASFLCKHLLIDWRWGEAYFAEKLLDFELSSNNGSWQWASSSGCDAAPYFRIFNPTSQLKKFDPKGEYCRRWIPELDSLNYPNPMVEHKIARERALRVYKEALNQN